MSPYITLVNVDQLRASTTSKPRRVIASLHGGGDAANYPETSVTTRHTRSIAELRPSPFHSARLSVQLPERDRPRRDTTPPGAGPVRETSLPAVARASAASRLPRRSTRRHSCRRVDPRDSCSGEPHQCDTKYTVPGVGPEPNALLGGEPSAARVSDRY